MQGPICRYHQFIYYHTNDKHSQFLCDTIKRTGVNCSETDGIYGAFEILTLLIGPKKRARGCIEFYVLATMKENV